MKQIENVQENNMPNAEESAMHVCVWVCVNVVRTF